MDIATWRDIEVLRGNFLTGDDDGILVDLFPRYEGLSDADDCLVRNVVLWIALDKLAARVEQEHLALSILVLRLVQEDNDAWS